MKCSARAVEFSGETLCDVFFYVRAWAGAGIFIPTRAVILLRRFEGFKERLMVIARIFGP